MKSVLMTFFVVAVIAIAPSCKEKTKKEKLQDAFEQAKDDAEDVAKKAKNAFEDAVE